MSQETRDEPEQPDNPYATSAVELTDRAEDNRLADYERLARAQRLINVLLYLPGYRSCSPCWSFPASTSGWCSG